MSDRLSLGKFFFGLAFVLLLFLVYRMVKPFLVPLILGLTLVSLFYPNFAALRRRLGGRANLSALLMCTVVTLLIVLPLLLFSLALYAELDDAFSGLRNAVLSDAGADSGNWLEHPWVKEAGQFLQRHFQVDLSRLDEYLEEQSRNLPQLLLRHTSSILGGAGALAFLLAQFFIMIFSMFFFFRDGEALLAEVKSLIPLAPQYKTKVLEKLQEVTQATFLGIFATGICQGLAAGVIFYLLGIRNPVLWGTATAFFSLVPVVGTAAVWVPMSIVLILQGSPVRGAALLVLGSTVIALVDNFLRPLVIDRSSSGMHLLMVFLSLAGGLLLFGISGLVLGPLAAALLLTFLEIYKIEFRDDLN